MLARALPLTVAGAAGCLALVVTGTSHFLPWRSSASGQQAASEPAIETLLSSWQDANFTCRGGQRDGVERACVERDQLERQLQAKGYCYGQGTVAGYQNTWRRCMNSDEEAAALSESQAAADRDAEASAYAQMASHQHQITSFFRVPLGWAKDDFQLWVTPDSCGVLDDFEVCQIGSPAVALCPTDHQCSDLNISFRNRQIVGVSASYRRAEWEALLLQARSMSSSPIPQSAMVGPMLASATSWQASGGYISFVRYAGNTLSGEPIEKYSIGFGDSLPMK